MKFLVLVAAFVFVACSSDDTTSTPDMGEDSSADQAEDTGPACTVLFGSPSQNTGLTSEQCAPSCDCEGRSFTAPEFSEARLEWMRGMVLDNPPQALTSDPYEDPAPEPTTEVCAVSITSDSTYRLDTFDSEDDAANAGASVTHTGACGLCSTLVDFAVYAGIPELTAPVRECGLEGIRGGDQANIDCLIDLGFTPDCAQIWFYNTRHTRNECAADCFANLNSPHHLEDGSLNACIQCDEDISGPVFKAYAGRTRRNTGIATALCRPCDQVRPIAHDYLP